MNNFGIFIYARCSSKRLPNKVLLKINKKPIIWYIYQRAKLISKCKKKNIFILTSKLKSDDRIVNFCKKNKINYYRGSLNNVLKRTINCAKENNIDYILRICGDRLFHDYDLETKMLKYNYKKYDLVTNNLMKTYPKGQTSEIIKVAELEKISKYKINNIHKEHVCNFFYNNKKKYNIKNFKSNYTQDQINLNLSIDNLYDFKKAKDCLKYFNYKFNIKSKDIINYYKRK